MNFLTTRSGDAARETKNADSDLLFRFGLIDAAPRQLTVSAIDQQKFGSFFRDAEASGDYDHIPAAR